MIDPMNTTTLPFDCDVLVVGAGDGQEVVAMAHGLQITVIAEGVETREQLRFLRDHGCDEVQGYYFSAAVPAEEFAQWLGQRAGATIAML